MAVKRTGLSLDLVIHPGETIAEVIEERGITQAELAARAGVSAAYVSNVIAGKKPISAKFAMGLEYALGVPKSFWLNLQSNYEAELLELNEEYTITDDEKRDCKKLEEVVDYLVARGIIPSAQRVEEIVLSLRKALQISSISTLGELVPEGAFRMSTKNSIEPVVLGAWLRLCQIIGDENTLETSFSLEKKEQLIAELKEVMLKPERVHQRELTQVLGRYGIDFSIVRNFKGAPVHGYISQKKDETYQMVLTIRGAYADIFWFSLFHELGHILNGDVTRGSKYIDIEENHNKTQEEAADSFASDALINATQYQQFIANGIYSYAEISKFALQQGVKPYIVIGRLQKEGHIPYTWHSRYKPRYRWAQ